VADLLVFAKVVEHGTFTAAARQLQVAKSQVTKQVARLETSLAVRLLHRTTRKMAPTEAGLAVLEQADAIARAADAATSVVGAYTGSPRGRIRVTASSSYALHVLAPLLPGFCERYPSVQVELLLVDRFVDLLDEGVDLALRLTDAPPPGLVGRPLHKAEFVVCATPGFLRGHRIQHPGDLRDVPCLSFGARAAPAGALWQFRREGARIDVPVKTPVVVNSSDIVRALVIRGMGAGLVPRFVVADDLLRRRLVQVVDEWEVQGTFGATAWMLWQPQRVLPSKVRVFVDFLVHELAADSTGVAGYRSG
jgi:DNA-binding transcriptional LysR family regulator